MTHIDRETGEPIPGVNVGEWPTYTGKEVYYTGDGFEFWEQGPDGLWEFTGDLTEDEALTACVL